MGHSNSAKPIDSELWVDNPALSELRAALGDVIDVAAKSPGKGELAQYTRSACWSMRACSPKPTMEPVLLYFTGGKDNRLLKADRTTLSEHFLKELTEPYLEFLSAFPAPDTKDLTHVVSDRLAVWAHLPTLANYLRTFALVTKPPTEIETTVAITEGRLPYQHDAEWRNAVEEYAMAVAKAYYTARLGAAGNLQDVHKTEPFDLVCTLETGIFRVEVKGSTADGSKVIVTRNEVRVSDDVRTTLFVVSNIERAGDGPKCKPNCGVIHVHPDWSPAPLPPSNELEALTYEYHCPQVETQVVSDLHLDL